MNKDQPTHRNKKNDNSFDDNNKSPRQEETSDKESANFLIDFITCYLLYAFLFIIPTVVLAVIFFFIGGAIIAWKEDFFDSIYQITIADLQLLCFIVAATVVYLKINEYLKINDRFHKGVKNVAVASTLLFITIYLRDIGWFSDHFSTWFVVLTYIFLFGLAAYSMIQLDVLKENNTNDS